MAIARLFRTLLGALVAAVLLTPPQAAHALVLLPSDSGHVEQRTTIGGSMLAHDPGVTDLLVSSGGCCGIGSLWITRNAYALFAIDAGLGQPLSAVLRFSVTPTGFPGRVSLSDIQSPAGAFQQVFSGLPTQDGRDLLADLGGGTSYGAQQVDPGPALALSFTLPQAALDSLAAARGGLFGVGFSGTAALVGILNSPLTLSDVTLTISTVPEPTTAPMLALGLLALLGWQRRGVRQALASPALTSSGLTLLK